MKKYLVIAFVLFSTVTLSSSELSWVDTQVEAIKPPRKGMSNSNIANIKSPFIFLKKNRSESKSKKYTKTKSKPTNYLRSKKTIVASSNSSDVISKKAPKHLILSAVINNSALINGKWYKLNDNIHSYKLSSVNRTSVVLTKGKRKLVLSTSDKKRNLKFK